MTSGFHDLQDRRLQERSLVIHASESWFESVKSGQFDFFEKLATKAISEGIIPWIIRSQSSRSQQIIQQDHIHILIGPRRPVGRNIYHAHPSYIWGFWYLDPEGVIWNSSLAALKFDADRINPQDAEYFFNGVSGYMLRENISKFQQNNCDTDLQPASAVIYLQELEHYKTAVHYLDSREIIETIAQSVAGRIYVKLHPQQSSSTRAALQTFCNKYQNIKISTHSIHDLSKASDVVVTQNSAAGFEALMQRKPVITCAKSDYHHATLVAKTKSELITALSKAPNHQQEFAFAAYFYWFMGQNMLEPNKPEFEERAWHILTNPS